MAPKKSPSQSSVNAAPPKSGSNAIRTIAPMLPLAIALVHGAVTNHRPQAAGPGPTTTSLSPKISPATATTVSLPACGGGTAASPACVAPLPMLSKGHPVNWWFVFKLNSDKFQGCGGGDTRTTPCPFGGDPQRTASYKHFSQQYLVASSEAAALQDGTKDCLGTTMDDPVGATFDEVYHGKYNYLIWNDQTYGDPKIQGCGDSCSGPWGHSKGMLSWNDAGEGFVMQVSTPSWPLAGSSQNPRKAGGNTLGCIVKPNDVEVSQHFFALRLSKADLVLVLRGLENASVATDKNNPQIVSNGGPADVQALVNGLGDKSASVAVVSGVLSTGVELVSKPSRLFVPPWQMVSSVLGGVPLRTANWWLGPNLLPSTTADTVMGCWDSTLDKPGAVEIATSGTWKGTVFGLKGGNSPDGNHAKIGVSTSTNDHLAIFGDENQEGSISGTNCDASQNGRGGMFYVMKNATLSSSLASLIAGDTVPVGSQ